jgi:hypothetical protein
MWWRQMPPVSRLTQLAASLPVSAPARQPESRPYSLEPTSIAAAFPKPLGFAHLDSRVDLQTARKDLTNHHRARARYLLVLVIERSCPA